MNDFSYTIAQLANHTCLMPYGQAIADHRRTITTNETGVLLWNAFTAGASEEEMLALLKSTYKANEEDMPMLAKDLTMFLHSLMQNGILAKESLPHSGYPATALAIGPVSFRIYAPETFIAAYFSAFVDKNASPCHMELHILPFAPIAHANGKILTRTAELIIFETDEAFVYLPTKSNFIHEMHIAKDARQTYLYADMHAFMPALFDELFHMLRFSFLALASQMDLLVVHSASILYHDKAYLFSGQSGAGKSTHTKLWSKHLSTPLLNGDLNMLGIQNDKVMCYGLPWCGTSGLYTSDAHPFGGITYLFQAKENHAATLSYDEAVLQLTKRSINPSHTSNQLQKTISLASKICKLQPAYELYCTRDVEAVTTIKSLID